MEEINRAGGNSGACHGQMYNMATLLRHGSAEQKRTYLPKIASGQLRLQSMAITEPTAGTDTSKIATTAVKHGGKYIVNGQKVWTSRVQHSDLMILLARTTPLSEVERKTEGMSLFLVDLREAIGPALKVRPIPNMVNHETNELFFDRLELPLQSLIGEEGQGFKYILDGLNAERALIAAECIGDGYWFIDKVTKYAKERVVFGRPIGQNQGVQFPIAKAFVKIEAANLMRYKACCYSMRGSPAAPKPTWRCFWLPRLRGKRPMLACNSTEDSGSRANTTWNGSSAKHACIRSRRSRRT